MAYSFHGRGFVFCGLVCQLGHFSGRISVCQGSNALGNARTQSGFSRLFNDGAGLWAERLKTDCAAGFFLEKFGAAGSR